MFGKGRLTGAIQGAADSVGSLSGALTAMVVAAMFLFIGGVALLLRARHAG